MGALERAEERVEDLRALLRDFRAARAVVPALSRPTRAVGARGSWTGSAAERLHRDELSPMSTDLSRALDKAEQTLLDELEDAVRDRTRARADAEAAEREREREREASR